ncbi:MAG: hypothetical protein AAFR25_04695 [Cyanobacteria bacterium J06629_19]
MQMLTVIICNCLIALLITYLAVGLWKWRTGLQQLTHRLQNISLSPRELSYVLTLRRLQLVETRLGMAKIKLRSRQVRQGLRLIQLLRILLAYQRRPL